MTSGREIAYLSAPAEVSMGNRWFEVSSVDHFWVRRRFGVLQRLAGELISKAKHIAEIGCGHGLLQRQVEDAYGSEVTGFDLNEFALKQNVSRVSPVCCYDIYQKDPMLEGRFDLIFLFDVLEHISDEDSFLAALKFHLSPGGNLVINVPAGQWAYSTYDVAAGHVRRYAIGNLRNVTERNNLKVVKWTYWGLPLVPTLVLRKVWLMGKHDHDKILSAGFDSRGGTINYLMEILTRCEPIPQTLVGTSLMAVLQTD
jgi:SAM-dependent methyltransferase